jgi:hypothetical protein
LLNYVRSAEGVQGTSAKDLVYANTDQNTLAVSSVTLFKIPLCSCSFHDVPLAPQISGFSACSACAFLHLHILVLRRVWTRSTRYADHTTSTRGNATKRKAAKTVARPPRHSEHVQKCRFSPPQILACPGTPGPRAACLSIPDPYHERPYSTAGQDMALSVIPSITSISKSKKSRALNWA